MASVVAKTAHTSQSRSSVMVGFWSVGGSLASSVFQYRSYSVYGLDRCVPLSPSIKRNAYKRRIAGWKNYPRVVGLNPIALKEDKRPILNRILASRKAEQNSCHDAAREGFDTGKQLAIRSASRHGNMKTPSSWITNEAIPNLKLCHQQGRSINPYMLVEILKQCSIQRDLTATRQVHDYIIPRGMQKQRYVATTLLSVYLKCGRLQDARRVFDGLERTHRTIITWNVMVGAYAKSGRGMEAYRLFQQMIWEGFKPDVITYTSILNPSASAGALEWVKDVHYHSRKAGLESDLRVGSAIVQMYAKSGNIDAARLVFDRLDKRDVITWSIMIRAYAETGSIDAARLVFDKMQVRDVVTWNIMIGAYAESGRGMEAYRLFLQMKREGFEPNAITFMNILNANASAGASEWIEDVHNHALKGGLESDLRVGNALVHMYAKCGSIHGARIVFDRVENRDVVTWTAMIGGLAQHGCGHEVLTIFRKMIADGVKPQEPTFVALLSACSHTGLVEDGCRLFSEMKQDYGVEATVVHYTCMVDLLGRAGHLEEAKLLIENMPVEADAVTWIALLGACRTHRNVGLGEYAAKEAMTLEPQNAAAYVLLSNIYAAAGKWEKVFSVREMMQMRGVRKEPGRSWIEVDDKIHEFAVGDASHPEAKAIYSVLQELTEKLKAKSYIPDTNLVLQNIEEEDKDLALCSHSEKLAIAYGLLRVPHGKPILVQKNLRVCSDCHTATKLISDVTGREIIVRDANRFHHFKDGVCSCHDYW